MSGLRSWHVEFDTAALRELRKMSAGPRQAILRYLRHRIETADDPRRFGKALTGTMSGLWRYRVSDYRIVCRIEDSKVVVLVLKVGHRSEIYR